MYSSDMQNALTITDNNWQIKNNDGAIRIIDVFKFRIPIAVAEPSKDDNANFTYHVIVSSIHMSPTKRFRYISAISLIEYSFLKCYCCSK